MTSKLRALVYVSLVALAVTGCSGSKNSSSRKPAVVNKVNGYVGASNIFNAIIYVVPIDVQGQPGLKEGDDEGYDGAVSSSNARAYFEVSLSEQQSLKPVIFIANAKKEGATTQRCELTGNCVTPSGANFGQTYPLDEDSFKLNAVVSSVGNGSRVNINWITHLASDMAYTSYIDEDGNPGTPPTSSDACLPSNNNFDCPTLNPTKPVKGMFTPFTVERGNIWLGKQFDFGGLDIISLRPIAPSALNEAKDLETIRRQQGIRYGALLAGGQKLANDAGVSEAAWLSSVVEQQRNNQGQLFVNHGSEFSKCQLYTAAESVLKSNLDKAFALDGGVKTDANAALTSLKGEQAAYCDVSKDTLTTVVVEIEEIKGWVDSFKQAKEFVDDLNKRILNMRCDNATEEGFFNCDYVVRTQAYYKDLETLYHTHQTDLDGALHQMRGDVQAFIACLNDPNATCTGFNAEKKEYKANGLTYSMVPLEETVFEKEGEPKKYFAFDFRVVGKRDIASTGISITFNPPKEKDDKGAVRVPELDEYNFLRVVYQGDTAYVVPAKLAFEDANGSAPDGTDGVEPLGFDFNFPNIELKAESTMQDFKLYLTTKLIGVKPLLDSSKAMHYNLTALGLGLNVQGDVLGKITEEGKGIELKDTAELTFKASFDNAADFYAKTLWPAKDDYFTTESGVTASEDIDDLFKYRLKKDETILISSTTDKDGKITKRVEGSADYFELTVEGIGTNRYEVFQNDKKRVLRNCSVSETGTVTDKENSKVCTSAETVKDDFDLITDLIYSDSKYFENFAIPGYGTYKPEIPAGIKWEDPATLESAWNGKLKAKFAQGITNAELRIAQEFAKALPDGKAERVPAAILVVKGSKKTATSWEIAVSMGYNYQYLVDVLPSGKDVESFYFSYFVNEYGNADGTKSYINELGSLSMLRKGTELLGTDAIANATIGGRVDYEIDTDPNNTNGCGYTNLGAVDKTCSAIAYLTVRGKLVGTLRKEKGLYVMRYSDGTFSILGI